MFPEYFYDLTTAMFLDGYENVFMDRNQFALKAAPKDLGTDVLVALSDLRKVWAPYMTVEEDEKGATIRYGGKTVRLAPDSNVMDVDGEKIEMPFAVRLVDGDIWVPAGNVMKLAFSKLVMCTKDGTLNIDPMRWPRKNTLVLISNADSVPVVDTYFSTINVAMRGKDRGELYEAFWSDEIDKVIPYSLYIPTTYNPDIPSKMIMVIHGGGKGEQFIYTLCSNKIQFYAEKYNYILLLPNAGPKGGSYGCPVPTRQNILGNEPKPGYDPKNPMGLSQEKMHENHIEERCVMHALELTLNKYNIDKSHIFLMGNSMGAIGTFYLPTIHPGLFRALSPSGGCPDLEYFDVEPLKGLPIRMVGGTEDYHGFDHIEYGYNQLIKKGHKACELIRVGGGQHPDAWTYVLEETFEFFERF